jgi:hypothetical protein
MAADAQAAKAAISADLRSALCWIAETYGPGICREPRRVIAMLRDLHPEMSRESFLVVAALREHVVSDIVASLDSIPDEILITRGIGRLRDNLGLAEDSARWAVESWLPACRVLAKTPDRPLHFDAPEPEEEDLIAAGQPFEWAWPALCVAASACAVVAIGSVARTAFFHSWNGFLPWLIDTASLATGLAVAGFGLAWTSRRIVCRRPPHPRALGRIPSTFSLLAELLALLTLPLAPVATAGIWIADWTGWLSVAGQPHDLAFHLGRILQSQALVVFLYYWLPLMVATLSKVAAAASTARRR